MFRLIFYFSPDQNSEENIEGHGAITVNGSAIFHNSVLQPTSPSFDFW